MDAGEPISYEVLERGTPVYSSDGHQVGSVTHVLAVPEEDVFDGIVLELHTSDRRHVGGGHHGAHDHHLGQDDHRFADADDVETIHERAVTLKLDSVQCADLPRPTENPAVMRDDPAESGSGLQGKLRRAWDLISGKY
ncbi:MAG: hypothetical protein WAK93_05715 [Solirubrobacteraceae bacterium]